MDLNAAKRLALDLMTEHGLIALGWTFAFDRAKRRAGQCKYGPKRITLSASYVEMNAEPEVRDTILHEIAHAHVGHAAGHGPVWQRMARSIGCNGERTTAAKIAPPGRYEIRCAAGEGHTLGHFHRRPSRTYSCKAHRVRVRIFDTHTGRFLDSTPVTLVLTNQPRINRPAPMAAAKPANPWDGGSDWDSMFNA